MVDRTGPRGEAARGASRSAPAFKRSFPNWKNFRLVEGETEVAPGIRLVNAPGHTPGHSAFLVSVGQSAADDFQRHGLRSGAARARIRNGRAPMIRTVRSAVETRRKLLDRVIADKMAICGAHFPFPGAGSFAKDGAGYAFTPVQA